MEETKNDVDTPSLVPFVTRGKRSLPPSRVRFTERVHRYLGGLRKYFGMTKYHTSNNHKSSGVQGFYTKVQVKV